MYKSGFAHTGNINQNTTLWSTGSTNGKACFYLDDDYCKSNALVQFRREFSYAISSDAADDAYITKTLHVSQNTNYVVNVMVKSTFLKAFTDDFSILPSYIKVLVGSTTLATSIDCVGITNEWTEMSVGFNSGTNTTVTLKVGAVFNSISKREAVYFSSIRVDQRYCFWLILGYIINIPKKTSFLKEIIQQMEIMELQKLQMRWHRSLRKC